MWSRHHWKDVSTKVTDEAGWMKLANVVLEEMENVVVEEMENVVLEEMENVVVEEMENFVVEEMTDESSPPITMAVNFETTSTPSKPKRRWLLRVGRGKVYAVEGLFE